MKLGVVYPQAELAGDPAALRKFALAAEDLGLDHIVMYDHVVGAQRADRDPPIMGHYDEHTPFHDPLVAFGYMAAITEQINFVTGILILPQRQTVLVARQTADVDLLSGGRLRLGVGAGYNPVEYHALGVPFAGRGKRLNEQVPYLRRLWSEEIIDFEGEFEQIDRANIVPRPARQIPIWFGGFAEVMFRRAVKLGDGFMFGYGLEAPAMQGWARVQELLAEAGRPVEAFGAHFDMHSPGDGYSDSEVLEGLHRLREGGATHVSIFTMHRGFRNVDQHIEYFTSINEQAHSLLI